MRKIDEIDFKILSILYEDADITNKELAAKMGIAPSTCLERVRRLNASGVIKSYNCNVNFQAIGGHIEAMAALKLARQTEEIVTQIRADLLSMPEVVNFYHMGGENNFFVHIAVRDTEHLRKFIFDAFMTRDEVINVETALVFEHHRSGKLPDFYAFEDDNQLRD